MPIKILLILLAIPNITFAAKYYTWNSKPITIEIPLGQEVLIKFPEEVAVGIPSHLENSVEITTEQKIVYLNAYMKFNNARFKFRLLPSNTIVLINIEVIPNSSTDDIIINIPKLDIKPSVKLSPITIMRHGLHHFYAPMRLIHENSAIYNIENKLVNLNNLFNGLNFGVLRASIAKMWQTDTGLYLTAIRLNNKTNQNQSLNYSDLNLDFKYASFKDLELAPNGMLGEQTMLFIITDKPFNNALHIK